MYYNYIYLYISIYLSIYLVRGVNRTVPHFRTSGQSARSAAGRQQAFSATRDHEI